MDSRKHERCLENVVKSGDFEMSNAEGVTSETVSKIASERDLKFCQRFPVNTPLKMCLFTEFTPGAAMLFL